MKVGWDVWTSQPIDADMFRVLGGLPIPTKTSCFFVSQARSPMW